MMILVVLGLVLAQLWFLALVFQRSRVTAVLLLIPGVLQVAGAASPGSVPAGLLLVTGLLAFVAWVFCAVWIDGAWKPALVCVALGITFHMMQRRRAEQRPTPPPAAVDTQAAPMGGW